MSDVVSGLLAKLDEEEVAANRMDHANPDDGGYYSCPAVHTEQYGDLPWGEDVCECRLEARRAAVLRLCRAHRDLIDMYVKAKAQPVAESVPHSKGRGLDHASAMGRLTTLGLVLQVLARGLGVEEQSSE